MSEQIHSNHRGNNDMAPLIEAYLAQFPEFISQIHSHVALEKGEEIAKLAHRLKGSGSGYGYPAITQAATTVEDDIRAGRKWVDSARALADVLSRCVL